MLINVVSQNAPSLTEDSRIVIIEDEANILKNVFEDISLEDLSNVGPIQYASRALVNNMTRTIEDAPIASRRLRMGYHRGHLQGLPPKWTFPKMTMKQLLENWFVGNKKESVPHLKLLVHLHVQHIGVQSNKNIG